MKRIARSLDRLVLPALVLAAALLGTPARQQAAAVLPENPFCRIELDPRNYFTRVVAPEPQGGALRASAVLSNITVNYIGFTPEAQAAFQAAVDVWQTQVRSTVPLVMNATFSDLGSTGLLGQAGFQNVSANFSGAPLANVYYPGPIANKLSGVDRNGATVEIAASFNSTASWNYGTDGVPVSGKVDFMSVVLHELGHGLGFVGSGRLVSGAGTIGFTYPYVYDASVVDSAGTSILNAAVYPNGSPALTALVTGTGVSGAGLFWNGAAGVAAAGGSRPRLFAPSPFLSGSSYHHLDDAAYPAGNINSLMTHAIGYAEVIHTPGPIALGMFSDMGWGSQCSFGLDRSVGNIGAAGGGINVTLSTTSGCAWTASTPASFVAITAGASGTASAVVRMTVAANAGAAGRVAAVTIGDQTFDIAQAGTAACTYALSPSSVGVTGAASSGVTALATAAGCAWTAASGNNSIATVSPASGIGPATISYNVLANAALAGRSATLTIGGQPFTIAQAGAAAGPAMSVDRPSLGFGAVTTGTAFTSNTGSQTVRLTQTGPGTVTWTAASTVPWLTVSPTSGTGPATLTLATKFVAGLGALQTGAVTLTFAGAGNTLSPIAVTQATFTAAQAMSPSGVFDTPLDGSTGVTGSIAVTGWALDDVDIARVRIMRDPVAGEAPGVLVYIGDASLVEGARPDVQAALSSLPRSYRGGWGYLMLTNFLPSLGSGTFRLTAIADDLDGHSTVLGSKTITCTNGSPSAVAPFGAIDTPSQGETVSGVITNFGWVLSPGSRRADVPGGGAVSVVVDGAIVGSPAGWSSRPDLSSLFPLAQFAGIAGSSAVFSLDTTTLTNGVHTIAWLVTDNMGTASGVGSRFFTVANGAGLSLSPPVATGDDGQLSSEGALTGRRGPDLRAPYQIYEAGADGTIAIDAEELDRIELRLRAGATAYARVHGALGPLPAGANLDTVTGTFTWQPGAGFSGGYDFVLGGRDVRIVLHPKGSGRVGPQVVIDTPLPPEGGSHESGLENHVASAGSKDPAYMDVGRTFRSGIAADTIFFRRKTPLVVAGWAADLDSRGGPGIQTVHVWAYPVATSSRPSADPIFLGVADYGGARPDVAAIYGDRFLRSGYGLRLDGLAPGSYDLAVFAYSTVTGGFVPARTVRVTVR